MFGGFTRAVACLLVLCAGVQCGLASPATAQDKPAIQAVATTSIIGDLVQNVGGARVDVVTLVGRNGDPHVFSPSPGDAKKLAQADIIFVNGLGLEGWITRLVEASGTKARTVIVSVGVVPRTLARAGQAERDPHAWQSLANAEIYVANIRDGLDAVDPAGKAIYDANAAAYSQKLAALDGEIKAAINKISAERRKVVIDHNAFGYFGDAYGLTIIPVAGLSTDAEPSAKDVAAIIALVKAQHVPAVFFENIADPRMMARIAEETGAAIGGKLYSDALSEEGGPASTYIDMMRYNGGEFSKALSGSEAKRDADSARAR